MFEDGTLPTSREEARKLLEMELGGSSSLNTRGTQLAGLTAASIAIIASAADRWFQASSATVDWILVGLLVPAVIAFVLAVYCALFAVLPTSRWRNTLRALLGEDLATEGTATPKTKAELDQALLSRYVTMAEHQRVRNQRKAEDMLLAYGFVAMGVVLVALAAAAFMASRAVCA